MTSNRKEPTFSSVPPTIDEPQGATSGNKKAPNKKSARPAAPVKAKSSPVALFALLLALVGLGGAGYLGWQLQLAQTNLVTTEARLESLERQLNLTDSEASQSVTVLQASLKKTREDLEVANSEIRKLWDTRNVNRKAIAANKSGVEAAKKKADKSTVTANSALTMAQSQEQNWKALSGDMVLQSEQITVVTDLAEGQQSQIRELTDVSNRVSSQLVGLQSDLAKRVAANEEAIASTDAFRRAALNDIQDLKRRLGSPAQ